jgi:DNA helicase-2/ATP-dependent DNA helicase PcrA
MMQGLNDAQQQAVSHFEGPMLVLAGPGSGKTRVITERVRYLIEEKNVPPASILVITFTKAAAMQMRERYLGLCSSCSGGVRFGTFHAIFFMILKHAYHYTADNIIRDEVRYDLLRRILHETDLEIQDEREFLNDLASEIGRVKGERIELSNYYSPLCSNEVFREMFQKYQSALERKRSIDFDDMLVYCYELLEKREDIRKIWQQQFRYILIDEFQDISKIQYDVVRLLGEPFHNIFIVGDDDQSIYGFRGAKPDIMKQFLRDYPNAGRCLLGINYRCAPEIVQAAGKVIEKNKNRMPKEICAGRKSGSDDVVEIREYSQPAEQNEAIREKLLVYRNQGMPYREMAVLFRTNTQARALSSKLMEFNIPFTMKERLPNIYEHWIVQDILTYVRIAKGNRERGQVLRIINRPKRYVNRNAFTEPYVDFEELMRFYEDKDWMADRIGQLRYDLTMLAQMKPYAAVNFIRRGIGYDEYIREYADYRGIRADDMYEILDELMEEARMHESFEDWFDYMQRYKEELREQAKKSFELQRGGRQADSVMLMTMHGAKGLEFECVFIPDANEGVTPHSKSVLDADMEEERRMFYVAMTRAKSHLHIYYLKERLNKEVEMSRFVEEITGNGSTVS